MKKIITIIALLTLSLLVIGCKTTEPTTPEVPEPDLYTESTDPLNLNLNNALTELDLLEQ